MFSSTLKLTSEQKDFLFSVKNLEIIHHENAKKTIKIYYVYRLTLNKSLVMQEDLGKWQYYYGYRGSDGDFLEDSQYLSSSNLIKRLVQKYGSKVFVKKIIGVYAIEKDALFKEVQLHTKFNVKKHESFFNLSNQTTTKFVFANTGRTQTPESNKKRSAILKNRQHTEKSKQQMRQTQLTRERSQEETQSRRQHAEHQNKIRVICPHCGKEVQKNAGKRWHFDNCLDNPAAPKKTFEEREQLRQKMRERNTKENKKEY